MDSETGWIYSGRYADWEKGRYVDGLACADMQRYIEEAGDITPEIMYRINDIGFGGRKSGISKSVDGAVSRHNLPRMESGARKREKTDK